LANDIKVDTADHQSF